MTLYSLKRSTGYLILTGFTLEYFPYTFLPAESILYARTFSLRLSLKTYQYCHYKYKWIAPCYLYFDTLIIVS